MNVCYKYMKMTYFIILLIVVPESRHRKCRLKFCLNVIQKSVHTVFPVNECFYPPSAKQFASGEQLK